GVAGRRDRIDMPPKLDEEFGRKRIELLGAVQGEDRDGAGIFAKDQAHHVVSDERDRAAAAGAALRRRGGASYSASIRSTSSATEGMALINPAPCPAAHTSRQGFVCSCGCSVP